MAAKKSSTGSTKPLLKPTTSKKQLNLAKKTPTKEDRAAVRIQKDVRRFLAKLKLEDLRKKKREYEEQMEKVQKEAYVQLVEQERRAHMKEMEKKSDERKREQERLKRLKRMIEAAYDGDVDEMQAVMRELEKADDARGVRRDEMGLIVRRMHMLEVIEARDRNDYTPLSEAAAGGSAEAIKFLVDRGADVNSIGGYGRSPLYRAAFSGHVSAVQLLLQQGADPRLVAEDGCTAAEVSSVEQVVETIKNWDVSVTDTLLERMKVEQERRMVEDQKRKAEEKNKLKNNLSSAKEECDRMEKVLLKCYHELEKRITEHDLVVAERNQRMIPVTLKMVKQAEEEVAAAKENAQNAKERLEDHRLMLRDQEKMDNELIGVKCNIRELDEVLFKDVGDRIKSSGNWPLLIDPSGQSSVFLRYRDTNYLCAINPSQMKPDVIRMALIGAIRFGKCFVLDMMEVDMFDVLHNIFDEVQPGLMDELMTKKILKDQNYLSLVKPTDDEVYQPSQFVHYTASKFQFVILSKSQHPNDELMAKTYPIRVIVKA